MTDLTDDELEKVNPYAPNETLRNTCGNCGSENPFEFSLKIDIDVTSVGWRDDGSIQGRLVVDGYTPADSANDPATGLVFEEAVVSCRDCGEETDISIDFGMIGRWSFA